VRAALRIVTEQRDLAERLWQVVHRVRDGVTRLGFRTSDTASPIVPLLAGDVESTYQVWRELLAAGLYVNLIAPPACRADACVLRLSCSSAHTDAQVDEALDVLGRVGRGAGLIA
jgi:8-amino-7-oxononanoate synthase